MVPADGTEISASSSAGEYGSRAGRRLRDHGGAAAALAGQVARDAGVPLPDVQEAASHADPRTTMRHAQARTSLDGHATYIVAAFTAGAAR